MATKKSGIDQDLVRDLATILNETDLTEIEIEQEDLRIRVSRSRDNAVTYYAPPTQQTAPASASAAGFGAAGFATDATHREVPCSVTRV